MFEVDGVKCVMEANVTNDIHCLLEPTNLDAIWSENEEVRQAMRTDIEFSTSRINGGRMCTLHVNTSHKVECRAPDTTKKSYWICNEVACRWCTIIHHDCVCLHPSTPFLLFSSYIY